MLTPAPVCLRQDLTIWASRSVRRLKPNQWMHKSAQEFADVWIIWIIASSIDAQELPAGHLHERCTHSPADTPEMLQCTDTWSNTGQIRHNKNPSLNVDRIHSLSQLRLPVLLMSEQLRIKSPTILLQVVPHCLRA